MAAAILGAVETASLDLNLLRTFLAVYRSGSFTGAARLLGLSQPTVTTQMRALERQTGRELFERLPRGVTPTPVADELAARVAAPLDELAAVAGPAPAAGSRAEPVHLAGPAELLCTTVLPALAPLVADGVRLRVSTGLTDPLLDELRAGRHDLVIATTRPRGRTLHAVPLTDEEFVLVTAPVWADRLRDARHARDIGEGGTEARDLGEGDPDDRGVPDGPEAGRSAVPETPAGDPGRSFDPALLHDVPLVTYAEDLPIARRYWRHVFGRRLTRTAAVTVPDLRGVLAAVTAGAGFGVLPRYLCQDLLESGVLVALLEPEDPPINTGFLVQRPGACDNPDVTRVRTFLLRAARDW
ncbi:LysR family transcriptional regulator [Streptomyces lavenduligriseus]|uniref:LysR family transcriptional regulator n=1 Tax=Streptomyces lavenduligriseus TaxID=67315 RepID=A0ABT0NVX8_9ACTN|nr:LysR family transcriptional regulator [Streptomyces lavenduligriseus]MCL3995630.1 LysR family transcriptional regulator [Streptomyces lavenduligriseus]